LYACVIYIFIHGLRCLLHAVERVVESPIFETPPEILPTSVIRVPRVPRSGRPAGQVRGTTPLSWTEHERFLFEEGLDLFGRDWKRLSDHIGPSRSLSNVKSHAQKHFIKLAKSGEPVPPKVAETGPGHTMDGKPLDLDSKTARGYLSNDNLDQKQRVLDEIYRQHAKEIQARQTQQQAPDLNEEGGPSNNDLEFPDDDDDDDDAVEDEMYLQKLPPRR
jgi:SHAQKYF class myb-like DNA-binding protein